MCLNKTFMRNYDKILRDNYNFTSKIMKKIYAILILMLSVASYAESNLEIRNTIQADVINLSTFPQDMGDGVTILSNITTSTRGIVYIYNLSLDQDELPNLSELSSNLYKQNLNNLCTNYVLGWYKINNVEMSYIYYDQSDNLITLFKISSIDC